MKRSATAVWSGTGKTGSGHLTTQSPALKQAKYSYTSRFEEGEGTNPEELIAAAHAGCFTMKLSFLLGDAGFVPDSLETISTVTLEAGEITGSHLTVQGKVSGITKEKFEELAKEAEVNCPVSKALKMKITMNATLL